MVHDERTTTGCALALVQSKLSSKRRHVHWIHHQHRDFWFGPTWFHFEDLHVPKIWALQRWIWHCWLLKPVSSRESGHMLVTHLNLHLPRHCLVRSTILCQTLWRQITQSQRKALEVHLLGSRSQISFLRISWAVPISLHWLVPDAKRVGPNDALYSLLKLLLSDFHADPFGLTLLDLLVLLLQEVSPHWATVHGQVWHDLCWARPRQAMVTAIQCDVRD